MSVSSVATATPFTMEMRFCWCRLSPGEIPRTKRLTTEDTEENLRDLRVLCGDFLCYNLTNQLIKEPGYGHCHQIPLRHAGQARGDAQLDPARGREGIRGPRY